MNRCGFARLIAPVALCAFLVSCAQTNQGGTQSASGGAGGGAEGSYKVGQPYKVGGEWYYPREDYSYDEAGVASWYGTEFHGQRTANGEVFNKNELTAAHKTLPLPTLARVTNLDNGRSIVVRINDRGPFSNGRLIDVSQRAAQLLGFEGTGTAKVRVQVLADESKAIADAMRHYGRGSEYPAEIAAGQQKASQQPELVATAPPPVGADGEPQPLVPEPASARQEALERPVSNRPVAPPLETAPVQSEALEPVRTTPEIHRQLLATQPVQEVVQLPVTGGHQLYIQAGAFTVQGNADHLRDSLSKFGGTSESTIVINGTTFYRVRVGPVTDVSKADALLAKIRASGVPAARTVVD
jgi:rare lipoprotein A